MTIPIKLNSTESLCKRQAAHGRAGGGYQSVIMMGPQAPEGPGAALAAAAGGRQRARARTRLAQTSATGLRLVTVPAMIMSLSPPCW